MHIRPGGAIRQQASQAFPVLSHIATTENSNNKVMRSIHFAFNGRGMRVEPFHRRR